MLKLAKWRVGLLEPFPTLPPASKAFAYTEEEILYWAKFVAKPSKYIFQFHFELHAWK